MEFEFRDEWLVGGKARAVVDYADSTGFGGMTQSMELAGRLGISAELARMMPDECVKLSAARAMESMPGLVEWGAGDAARADLAVKNAEALARWSGSFRNMEKARPGGWGIAKAGPENGEERVKADWENLSEKNAWGESARNGAAAQEALDNDFQTGGKGAGGEAGQGGTAYGGEDSGQGGIGSGGEENQPGLGIDSAAALALPAGEKAGGESFGQGEIAEVFGQGEIAGGEDSGQGGIAGLIGEFGSGDMSGEDLAELAAGELAARNLGKKEYGDGGASFGTNVKRTLWNGLAELNQSFAATLWAGAENLLGENSAIAKYLKDNWVDYYAKLKGPEPQPDNALSGFVHDALRIAPQMAVNMGSGMAGAGLAIGQMAAQIFGSSYAWLRERGVSPLNAAGGSAMNAAGQAPLEWLGTSGILKAFSNSTKRGVIGEAARAMLREGTTEALQKAPEYVSHAWALSSLHGDDAAARVAWFADYVADFNNFKQATAEAIYEGLLGAVWGGALGGTGALASLRKEGPMEAEEAWHLDFLREMSARAARRTALEKAMGDGRAALREAPAAGDFEALAQMAEAALPDGRKSGWLDAADIGLLLQEYSSSPQALLKLLGRDADALNAAMAAGAPIEISLGRLLAHEDDGLVESVMLALRDEPQGLSGAEARSFDPRARVERALSHLLLQEEDGGAVDDMAPGEYQDALLAEAVDARRTAAAVRRQKTRLARMLLEAGYTSEYADAAAELMAANALANRDAYGLDPEALLGRYNIAGSRDAARAGGEAYAAGAEEEKEPSPSAYASKSASPSDSSQGQALDEAGGGNLTDASALTDRPSIPLPDPDINRAINYKDNEAAVFPALSGNAGRTPVPSRGENTLYSTGEDVNGGNDSNGNDSFENEEGPIIYKGKEIKFSEEYKKGPRELWTEEAEKGLQEYLDNQPQWKQDNWGPEYREFAGRLPEAISHLLKVKKGYVPAAFYLEGIGYVDLPYGHGGKHGYGLAHLIEHRNDQDLNGALFAKAIPYIIKNGSLQFDDKRNAIVFAEKTSKAIIPLSFHNQANAWILTSFPLKSEIDNWRGWIGPFNPNGGEINDSFVFLPPYARKDQNQNTGAEEEKEPSPSAYASKPTSPSDLKEAGGGNFPDASALTDRPAIPLPDPSENQTDNNAGAGEGKSPRSTAYADKLASPRSFSVKLAEADSLTSTEADPSSRGRRTPLPDLAQNGAMAGDGTGGVSPSRHTSNSLSDSGANENSANGPEAGDGILPYTSAYAGKPTNPLPDSGAKFQPGAGEGSLPNSSAYAGKPTSPSDLKEAGEGNRPDSSALTDRPAFSLPDPDIDSQTDNVAGPPIHSGNVSDNARGTPGQTRGKKTLYSAGNDVNDQNRIIRGQAKFGNGQIDITVFRDRDLSTIPHELGHGFVETLINISGNDGSIAAQRLEKRINSLLSRADNEPELAEIFNKAFGVEPGQTFQIIESFRNKENSQNSFEEGARAGAEKALASLRKEASALRKKVKSANEALERARQAQAAEPEGEWGRPEMDFEEMLANDPVYQKEKDADILGRRLYAVNGACRVLRDCLRHLDGLARAREDLAILKEKAGLARDADITAGSANWVKLHEGAVRDFLSYLKEGKAPAGRLAGVFARFRKWLLAVYQKAKAAFGDDLNEDARRVYDRMLATDREIRQSEGLGRLLSQERAFAERMAGLITPDEAKRLAGLRERAAGNLAMRADGQLLKERKERWKAHFEQSLQRVRREDLWAILAEMELNRGASYAQAKAVLGEEAAARLAQARPAAFAEGGFDLEAHLAAREMAKENPLDIQSFLSAAHEAIVENSLSERSLARQMADRAMELEDAKSADARREMAASAFSDYLAALDGIALRLVAEKAYAKEEKALRERYVQGNMMPGQLIERQAAEALEDMPLRGIRPARFQKALERALADREKAMSDGNVMAALEAVNRARVANEMIRQSLRWLAEGRALEDLAARCRKIKPENLDPDAREALRLVLASYGLGNMRGAEDGARTAAGLRDLIARTIPEGEITGVLPQFSDWLLNGRFPYENGPLRAMNWRDLKPGHLRELGDLIKYLVHQGRENLADDKKAMAGEIRRMALACAQAMSRLDSRKVLPHDSARGKAADMLGRLYASVDQLRWQFRKADGLCNLLGEGTMGLMERELAEVTRAENRVRMRMSAMAQMLEPHLARLTQTCRRLEKKYGRHMKIMGADGKAVLAPQAIAQAYGVREWTPDQLISLALNMGNKSNMARLRGYNDLNYQMVAELLGDRMAMRMFGPQQANADRARDGLLELADWKAIQGVWDSIATLWPDTAAAHEKMYGFRPEGIRAEPILFSARDGHEMLRGGYYPVKYDGRVSDKVAGFSAMDDLKSVAESIMAVPAAKKGHTQQRAQEAPGLPVLLNSSVLLAHIRDAVRFIELGAITRRLDRITRDPLFKAEYERVYGKTDYAAIRPNLAGLVLDENPDPANILGEVADKIRKYLVPWGLAWNFKVAALQTTAAFSGMADLGAGPVAKAMARLTVNPGLVRQIWQVSPYLKSRLFNIDQDLQTKMRGLGKSGLEFRIAGKTWSYEDVVNMGMLPIVAVDAATCGAIWLAAYRKKLNELTKNGGETGLSLDETLADPDARAAEKTAGQAEGQSAGNEKAAGHNEASPAGNEAQGPDPLLFQNEEGGQIKAASQASQDDLARAQKALAEKRQGQAAGEAQAAGQSGQSQASAQAAGPRLQSSALLDIESSFHQQAVEYADGIVKQSNPDYDGSSRSAFLRSRRHFTRLFNQFASAISLYAARHKFMYTARKKGKIGMGGLLRFEFYENVLPATFMFLLLSLARGLFADKDREKKEAKKLFARTFMDQALIRLPIFGSILGDTALRAAGLEQGASKSGMRNIVDTGIDMLARPAQAAGSFARKGQKARKQAETLAWSAFDLISFLSRIPISKLARNAKKGWEQRQKGQGTIFSTLSPRAK